MFCDEFGKAGRGELAAGIDEAGVGHGLEDLRLRGVALHAHLGDRGAVRDHRIGAGKFIDLERAVVRVAGTLRGFRQQVGRGRGEVVVVERRRPREQMLVGRPLPDVVVDGGDHRLPEGERDRVGQRGVRVGIVGEDQRVVGGRVGEIIVDAVFLHQPCDEVERGLVVLHTEFQRLAAGLVLPLVGQLGETVPAENIVDDRPDRHVLVDVAVLHARQQPDPRTQLQAILVGTALQPVIHRARDDAVEVALALVRQCDRQRARCTDPGGQVGLRLVARQRQVVLERPSQLLGRLQAVQPQRDAGVRNDLDRDVALAGLAAAAARHVPPLP